MVFEIQFDGCEGNYNSRGMKLGNLFAGIIIRVQYMERGARS